MGKVSQRVINKMMDRAIEINRQWKEECRDFTIMVSPLRSNTLLLRWTTINIENIDNPIQCYFYECFNTDGTPQNCSVNYTDQEEANEFFWSLEKRYEQQFASDHRQRGIKKTGSKKVKTRRQ